MLSNAARENPGAYRALLHIANAHFSLARCVGGRIGRGLNTIIGVYILAEDPLRKIGAVLGLFWISPGLSWLPLGLSWNSSKPLGSSLAALGLSWTSLFVPF